MNGGKLDWEPDQRSHSGVAGARKDHTPVRMCLGCRERALIGDLLRVVAMDGYVVVDERRRLPGRGAWLHHDAGCLAKAERRKAFPRALRVSGGVDLALVLDYVGQCSQRRTDAGVPQRNRNEGSRSTRHESAVKLKP